MAIAGGIGAVSLSGCAAMVNVQDSECGRVLTVGRCRVLVENSGIPGEYEVVVKYLDGDRTVGEDTAIVHLDRGEQRVVDINANPPSRANRYTVDVSSTII